jgi:hypothetical protein
MTRPYVPQSWVDNSAPAINATHLDYIEAGIFAASLAPYYLVSPIGLSSTGIFNNGADFGPDTPGTTTCGIQEALNALPSYSTIDPQGNSITAQCGTVHCLHGVFRTSNTITIGPGAITFWGQGMGSSSGAQPAFTPYEYFGGTLIVNSNPSVSTFVCALDAHGVPATNLQMWGFEMRVIGPVSYTSSSPDVYQFFGFETGSVHDIFFSEVATGGTGFQTNTQNLVNFYVGALTDYGEIYNIEAYGGTYGFILDRAHTRCYNIIAGHQSYISFDYSFNLDQYLANWHIYVANYSLVANIGYATGVPAAVTLWGMMYEGCTHYATTNNNTTTSGAVLIIDSPTWNTGGLNPSTDIASQNTYSLTTGVGSYVITQHEVDTIGYGTSRHVTIPAASITASAIHSSPATFPIYPFGVTVVLTTAGGISALTLDGTAVSMSVGIPIHVEANHTLIVTWSGTSPVFEVIPD